MNLSIDFPFEQVAQTLCDYSAGLIDRAMSAETWADFNMCRDKADAAHEIAVLLKEKMKAEQAEKFDAALDKYREALVRKMGVDDLRKRG